MFRIIFYSAMAITMGYFSFFFFFIIEREDMDFNTLGWILLASCMAHIVAIWKELDDEEDRHRQKIWGKYDE